MDNFIEQKIHRIINNFAFLVPAHKVRVDFDVITATSFSAFLEISITLLDVLGEISPHELQSFLGVNVPEREELIRQLISTDLAMFDEKGILIATDKLLELKQNDGTISLEDVEHHESVFYVDLLTGHIQKSEYSVNLKGFQFLSSEDVVHKKIDYETVFRKDFKRFQYSSKVENIKSQKSRLYRINICSYDKLISLPVSVDIYSRRQADGKLEIRSMLKGGNNADTDFIASSGMLSHINSRLNTQSNEEVNLSFSEYCDCVNDNVLSNYIMNNGEFDIDKYLLDRDNKKTGYSTSKTSGIVGPLSLPKNRGSFLQWASRIHSGMPMFWLPSSSIYWGSSIYSGEFFEKINELLLKKNSSLSLVLPSSTPQEAYELRQRYRGLSNYILFSEHRESLSEMEIFIMPGKPCWAMVQYHAKIKNDFGFNNMRIPIGYTTYDPKRVKKIWELLLRKYNLSEINVSEIRKKNRQDTPPEEVLDCFTKPIFWEEESNEDSN